VADVLRSVLSTCKYHIFVSPYALEQSDDHLGKKAYRC
jgi:hypothetical protein